MVKIKLVELSELEEKVPFRAKVSSTELIIIKDKDLISILYGRCLHRDALLSDGKVVGKDIICGVHNWDYSYETGISSYNPSEVLQKFTEIIENGSVYIDDEEVKKWETKNPQNFPLENELEYYSDNKSTAEEPYVKYISKLAKEDLSKKGGHGDSVSMGVPRNELPSWDTIQFVTAQLSKFPLLDKHPVKTEVIIGPNAKKPLKLKIPLFVSDMSFGALSKEAKIALSKGAELAGTGICSGEGGMLEEEQSENSKYFYELASAKFGFSWDKVMKCQAFHFKGGQGAKTGTGGHLPGEKVVGDIAKVRGLKEGQDAISPAAFPNWGIEDYKKFAQQVREKTGGIPVGFKLSAQHIEEDISVALEIGCDYIILDGRGGGTGSAPSIFRDNISVPTIPALARARKYLNEKGRKDITLIITGGLRVPKDFAKAMALGADAIAISNSAMQALGCVGMRACGSNNCPVGIATQKENLRERLVIQAGAIRVKNFFNSSIHLMKILARACGHDDLSKFEQNDITTFNKDMHHLTGIKYGGVIE